MVATPCRPTAPHATVSSSPRLSAYFSASQLPSNVSMASSGSASATGNYGLPSAASPSATGRGKSQDFFVQQNQQRAAIVREEAEVRTQMLKNFETMKIDIVAYIAKREKLGVRNDRRRKVESQRQHKAIIRTLESLETEVEKDHRSNIRILEDKCRLALQRIASIEHAVLACKEMLIRVVEMETKRRTFLSSYEEKERSEIERMSVGSLWSPSMQCLGKCPFSRVTDCPFHEGRCYGLLLDPVHLSQRKE